MTPPPLRYGKRHRRPPYICGHESEPVILDNNCLSISFYLEWLEDNEGLCHKCWAEKHGGS